MLAASTQVGDATMGESSKCGQRQDTSGSTGSFAMFAIAAPRAFAARVASGHSVCSASMCELGRASGVHITERVCIHSGEAATHDRGWSSVARGREVSAQSFRPRAAGRIRCLLRGPEQAIVAATLHANSGFLPLSSLSMLSVDVSCRGSTRQRDCEGSASDSAPCPLEPLPDMFGVGEIMVFSTSFCAVVASKDGVAHNVSCDGVETGSSTRCGNKSRFLPCQGRSPPYYELPPPEAARTCLFQMRGYVVVLRHQALIMW